MIKSYHNHNHHKIKITQEATAGGSCPKSSDDTCKCPGGHICYSVIIILQMPRWTLLSSLDSILCIYYKFLHLVSWFANTHSCHHLGHTLSVSPMLSNLNRYFTGAPQETWIKVRIWRVTFVIVIITFFCPVHLNLNLNHICNCHHHFLLSSSLLWAIVCIVSPISCYHNHNYHPHHNNHNWPRSPFCPVLWAGWIRNLRRATRTSDGGIRWWGIAPNLSFVKSKLAALWKPNQ